MADNEATSPELSWKVANARGWLAVAAAVSEIPTIPPLFITGHLTALLALTRFWGAYYVADSILFGVGWHLKPSRLGIFFGALCGVAGGIIFTILGFHSWGGAALAATLLLIVKGLAELFLATRRYLETEPAAGSGRSRELARASFATLWTAHFALLLLPFWTVLLGGINFVIMLLMAPAMFFYASASRDGESR